MQQGVEIVIEQDHRPVAVLKPSASTQPSRKLSKCIPLAKAYEAKLGYPPIPDGNFAADVQAGIDERRDFSTADLLIGATALHYSYAMGTRNVRHFRMIPGLQVVSL